MKSPYTEKPLHTEAFTHSKLLQRASFYTEMLLHAESCYTEQAFTQRSFYTEKLLHTERFYTDSEKILHPANFWTEKMCCMTNLYRSLDAATPIRFTISSCNSHGAKQPWRSHYNAICRERVAKHKNLMARTSQIAAELQSTQELRTTAAEIAAPKPDGSRRQSKKKILKHFLKGF